MIEEKLIEKMFINIVLKMNKEIIVKAKQILSNVLEIEINSISDDANPSNIQNWDSMNQIKLSLELEKEINRELSTDEILSLNSLKNIVAILEKKIN